MKLEVADISEANFEHLFDCSTAAVGKDDGCKFCLYWEEPDPEQWPKSLEERAERKRHWFRRVTAEFGVCGKLAFIDGVPVAYAQFAPARYLPNAAAYRCAPPSDDAVFVSCLYVPGRAKAGIGSALLEAIVGDTRAHGVTALETFARKRSANNPSGPLEFWLKHGFSVVREDEDFALVHRKLGSQVPTPATESER